VLHRLHATAELALPAGFAQKMGPCWLAVAAMATVPRLLRVTHTVRATQAASFDACVYGWREGNFGLPIPPPFVRARGDEETAQGLELMRVPPFLVERIRAAERPHRLEYGVANPGPLTYPVSRHRGLITFVQAAPETVRITWRVEWTPLWWSAGQVRLMTEAIVRAAAEYTARRAAAGAPPLSVEVELQTVEDAALLPHAAPHQ
jgi:hypothetical protein